jgi:hypothetical protein
MGFQRISRKKVRECVCGAVFSIDDLSSTVFLQSQLSPCLGLSIALYITSNLEGCEL